MNKLTRYTVTGDFYILAKDDEDANKQAKKWAKTMDEIHDNNAQVLALHETPFASKYARKVKIG